jgi:hypothetical protein
MWMYIEGGAARGTWLLICVAGEGYVRTRLRDRFDCQKVGKSLNQSSVVGTPVLLTTEVVLGSTPCGDACVSNMQCMLLSCSHGGLGGGLGVPMPVACAVALVW